MHKETIKRNEVIAFKDDYVKIEPSRYLNDGTIVWKITISKGTTTIRGEFHDITVGLGKSQDEKTLSELVEIGFEL